MAAPPTRPSSRSKPSERLRATQSITRRTCAITSGPMPSPGRINSFLFAAMARLPLSCLFWGLGLTVFGRLRLSQSGFGRKVGERRPGRREAAEVGAVGGGEVLRSEEHTSELQSLM